MKNDLMGLNQAELKKNKKPIPAHPAKDGRTANAFGTKAPVPRVPIY